jgi:hypothetical protein
MKTWILWRALLCAPVALGTVAEVVQTRERDYVVRYTDNAVERYSVKWTLDVTTTARDVGGSFVPYQANRENHRCAWSVASRIDRTVSLVTRLGQAMPLPTLSSSMKNEGEVKGEADEPCSSPRSKREADTRAAAGTALEKFRTLTDADLEVLKQAARANPNVASISDP